MVRKTIMKIKVKMTNLNTKKKRLKNPAMPMGSTLMNFLMNL